jgi:hypothetical protein
MVRGTPSINHYSTMLCEFGPSRWNFPDAARWRLQRRLTIEEDGNMPPAQAKRFPGGDAALKV